MVEITSDGEIAVPPSVTAGGALWWWGEEYRGLALAR